MTGLNKKITEMTVQELKELRLERTSEQIPTLKEVITIVKGRVPIYIELKDSTLCIGKLEKAVRKVMKSYSGKWCVMAFNPLRLLWFYNNERNINRCQLIAKKSKLLLFSKLNKITSCRYVWKHISKPSLLGYNKEYVNIQAAITAAENNALLLCWTVKSQQELDKIDRFADKIIFEDFIPKCDRKDDLNAIHFS